MHGIGNNFVLINPNTYLSETDLASLALRVCSSKSVGSDGLLVVLPHPEADAEIIMLNPDGGRAELCGNGLRCSAAWCHRYLKAPNPVRLVMANRLYSALRQEDGRYAVAMGSATVEPSVELGPNELAGLTGVPVQIGNPHLVIVAPQGEAKRLAKAFGPTLEHHPSFPQRTNVHFVEQIGPSHLVQHTWERGAGITWACGSGACACTAAILAKEGGEPTRTVELPGGVLTIQQAPDLSLTMIGPATFICEAELD